MRKKKNISGGGSKTNENGLSYEQKTSIKKILKKAGFKFNKKYIVKNKEKIGMHFVKSEIYSCFLEVHGVNWAKVNSKRHEPDEVIINFKKKTAYIFEKKSQASSGSVDEKLPGCDFKKKEYEKLFNPIGYKVEYSYILTENWFSQNVYIDYLEYIRSVGCFYFFDKIPVDFLELN